MYPCGIQRKLKKKKKKAHRVKHQCFLTSAGSKPNIFFADISSDSASLQLIKQHNVGGRLLSRGFTIIPSFQTQSSAP